MCIYSHKLRVTEIAVSAQNTEFQSKCCLILGSILLDNCPRCNCLTLGRYPELESDDAEVYLHRTP